jgi:hypothetical protein
MSFADSLLAAADAHSWRQALVAILIGYLMSQAIAACYAWTYRGLSYSRALVQALAVAGALSAMLMLVMGNSLARGIAIVGTLTLIRFRTNLRDPMDMVFVFASFGAGIAAGTGNIATGLVGTAVFIVVASMLRATSFGAVRQYDGLLRLRVPTTPEAEQQLKAVLRDQCARFSLVTIREIGQGQALEHAYQVTLLERGREAALLQALAAVPGLTSASVSMQEASVEL